MLFNSLTFVVFFIGLLIAYRLIPSWTGRKWLLLLASYVFYAAWNPPLILLLWISTLIDWFAAKAIAATDGPRRRRLWLCVSLIGNLGLLGYFKYGSFLLENFTAALTRLGIDFQAAPPSIILPVGISFYTFQTLSYTLDVYFRRGDTVKSPLDFALFVTFFPQLVAGPIIRTSQFVPQCQTPQRASAKQLGWGLFLLTLGLFQKVVVADVLLAKTADDVFGWPFGPVGTIDAWIGVLAFSGQIFNDFAGYSTCAIGVALCFGFVMPDNFDRPYAARGFRDFWRRWHISLSTWLRDYLYIPLGGSHNGNLRLIVALMLTMLIGGLWHGAAWTFVVWGGLHGLFLVAERFFGQRFGDRAWASHPLTIVLLIALTQLLVLITWVFFRAQSFGQAGLILAAMAGIISVGAKILATTQIVQVLVVYAFLVAIHAACAERRLETIAESLPSWLIASLWTAMAGSLILAQGSGDAFIYFQF